MRFFAVAVVGFVLGGWAVPLGFVLGLGPMVTFLAAAGGGLVGCWAFILVGDRFAAWAARRRRAKTDDESSSADDADDGAADRGDSDEDASAGRVRQFVDRHGVRGLGLIGPIFPGVTASVAGGLALGLPRRELGKWMTIGILAMYGLYTLGLALLISVF